MWREETEEETAAREAEWNAVYVRCRTCHFGSIETEFGEDQCPDCSSTMFVPVEPDMVLLIDKHGIEGEPFNRNFHDDGAGLIYTNLLKQGTYAVIKIGGDDE